MRKPVTITITYFVDCPQRLAEDSEPWETRFWSVTDAVERFLLESGIATTIESSLDGNNWNILMY